MTEGPDEDLPLHDEAVAREKWRAADAEAGENSQDDEESGDGDGRPGKGSPGTIPPPD